MVDLKITDGTSRADRYSSALTDGYINVDELSFCDLLALGSDYACVFDFYNNDNKQEGNWEKFFTSDETIIIAKIQTTELNKYEIDFQNDYNNTPDDDCCLYLPLADYSFRLARLIDSWLARLGSIESPISNGLEGDIERVVKKRLVKELHDTASIISQYIRDSDMKFDFSGFTDIWKMDDKGYTSNYLQHTSHLSSDIKSVKNVLRSGFYAFCHTIDHIKKISFPYLLDSLKNQHHNPAVGLYIAFIKLLKNAQESLNGFTGRHNEFYYYDVLKIRPKRFLPDSTYLIFNNVGRGQTVKIDKETEFVAGKDSSNKELIYTADNSLTVTGAQIEWIKTLYFERDIMITPPELNIITGIKQNNIHAGKKMSDAGNKDLTYWPLFGETTNKSNKGKLEDTLIGFTIASPILFLKEGERCIELNFGFNGEEGLSFDSIIRKIGNDLGINENEAFYKVFEKFFKISVTTKDGWLELPHYYSISSIVDENCPSDCLIVRCLLGSDVPPISTLLPEMDDCAYDTDLPLIKFVLDPQSYLFPYSLLKDLLIDKIDIKVDVKGAKSLLLHNNSGQLSPSTPFNPFGPIPGIGAYLIVGNIEVANKMVTNLNVNIEWGELPTDAGGFEAYYNLYDRLFNNSIFEARVSVLTDGKWLPEIENNQPVVKLFQSERDEEFELITNKLSKTTKLQCNVLKDYRPCRSAALKDSFNYNIDSKSGFVKFTLSAPDYLFGHKDYPELLSKVLTENARLKQELPLPSQPYTPLINSISIDYEAHSHFNFREYESGNHKGLKFFHLHPFGLEEIYSAKRYLRTYLLPRYESDKNLFLGIKDAPPGVVTLFFHLREDFGLISSTRPPEIQWSILSKNSWKVIAKSHIMSDTTKGFLSSGIVSIDIPKGIDLNNTIMTEGLLWLRVSAPGKFKNLCSVYSITTQALQVTWQNRGNSLEHLKDGLPAGTIKGSKKTIKGIGSILQITKSVKGRAEEKKENVQIRIRERLRHKNRATTPWDYERLILEQFPEIYKVKCFPNMKSHKWKRPHPGHVLIAVIPQKEEEGADGNFESMANSYLLNEITEFVKKLSSHFVNVEVRNPVYEKIQIRLTVKFVSDVSGGYYIKKLNQSITDYLSPWHSTGYTASFGWSIHSSDIKSFISGLEDVDYLTNFSMLHIVEYGANYYGLSDTIMQDPDDDTRVIKFKEILPVFPWSIAIPLEQHYIQVMDKAYNIEAKPPGIDELEIGSTFIVA
ncbi:MAG: hypothetical protein GY941_08310 [Planctomycetes bacterium]|nr:hypothetical protein [Planctomycetota bacterium]